MLKNAEFTQAIDFKLILGSSDDVVTLHHGTYIRSNQRKAPPRTPCTSRYYQFYYVYVFNNCFPFDDQ